MDRRSLALVAAAALGIALAVYRPALEGPFVSDDQHYVATNPYVHDLTLDNVRDVLDPTSPATVLIVNYAPVQLLLHAGMWQIVGDDTLGHHLLNVVLHALGAVLLVLLLLDVGLGRAAALSGGLLFLVHPANVEAVAWISQLKTSSAFALSLAALLLHPRRPALAVACFALALLAKPTAAYALPVVAVLEWSRRDAARFRWVAVWALALAAYAVVEFWTHERSGSVEPIHPDRLVQLRTVVAFGAHYLWMAATSLGVSAFHEPGPSPSWLDPRFLAGLAAGAVLAVRSAVAARRRSPELAFWVWAAASFVPISQLFPFLHPLADRYLYFILPGLLGGALFWLRDLAPLLERAPKLGPHIGRVGIAVVLALAALFAARSHERARLWASPALLLADSAKHYPDGRTAHLIRARRAARAGDADTAIAALRAAWERGFNRFEQLQSDRGYAPLRDDPRFRALVREIAGWWIDKLADTPSPTQFELRTWAVAHLARGEREEALRRMEQALAVGGPLDERLREEIEQIRQSGRSSVSPTTPARRSATRR